MGDQAGNSEEKELFMHKLVVIICLFFITSVLLSCKEQSKSNQEIKFTWQTITTANAPKPIGLYSQAIKCHKTVYISGQIGVDPETMLVSSGIPENQIRQIFDNLSAIIKASGGSMADVAKMNIYLTDLNLNNKINEIMGEYFKEPYPARTLIGVATLPKRAKVEIDAVLQLNN